MKKFPHPVYLAKGTDLPPLENGKPWTGDYHGYIGKGKLTLVYYHEIAERWYDLHQTKYKMPKTVHCDPNKAWWYKKKQMRLVKNIKHGKKKDRS